MSLDNPEHSLSNGPAGPSTQPPRSPSSRLQRLTSLSARRTRSHELSEMNHVIRTASSRSEDPELPRPPRAPSPEPPEANAPPPEGEVTRLRLSAHYAILVLASMVGTLIRLGLEALATCECPLLRGIIRGLG